MKRFFDPCRRHRRNISLLAADAWSESEKHAVERHLSDCADCRKHFEEVKAVTASLANLAESVPQLQPGPSARARWSEAILEAGRPAAVRRLAPAVAFRDWWRGVIWPHRRVWAGLAAVWVMILAENLSLPGHVRIPTSKPSAQEMIAAFRDQQRILAELLANNPVSREPEPPKVLAPGPRTEASMAWTT